MFSVPIVLHRRFASREPLTTASTTHMCKNSSGIHIMRTNIDIDEEIMAEVMRETGARTKREAVMLGLKKLLEHERRMKAQRELKNLGGKINWVGDLEAMRLD
jgi:Arc/MetJ family transcription regulator